MPKTAVVAVAAFYILAGHAAAFAAAPADFDTLGPPAVLGPVDHGQPLSNTTMSSTFKIPYRVEILFHHDLARTDPKAYVTVANDIADGDVLPGVGDLIVIDDTHTGTVTSRTFSYDAAYKCLCLLRIYADPVPRPTPQPH
jgi:hypothetical protein